MSFKRCARCGRIRPVGLYDDEGGSADHPVPPFGVSEAAWAAFGGQEVCPQCQSPEERRDAAQRIEAMVVREIERRQQAGVPPDPYEAALVNYAMAIRARDEIAQSVSTADSPAPGEPADRSDGLQLRVAFTGAFLTGYPLAAHLHLYGSLQRKLGARLTAPQWCTEGLSGQGGTYESGGGFSEAVPLIIVRREGADLLPWLTSALEDPGHAERSPLRRYAPALATATPMSLTIDIYDLGVAVLTTEFDVVATADTKADDTARAVKRLARLRTVGEGRSPLADVLQQIASSTARAYGKAVTAAAPDELRQAAWLSHPDDRPRDEGRLLWLHPVQVLEGNRDFTESMANAMAPAFSETVEIDGGVFVTGIGWSVVGVSRGRAEATPLQLTKLHWAYYALYMEIDRGLLDILDEPRWRQPASLRDLEADADQVFADYLRVMDARARLDSALNARGGDELAVWETIAKVQRFDLLVEAVGRKLDALEKVAQRRIDQTTAIRDRRIGYILGFLAFLSLVTLSIAIVSAVVGSVPASGWPVPARVATIGSAFVVAAALFWLFFIRTARVPAALARQRRKSSRSR